MRWSVWLTLCVITGWLHGCAARSWLPSLRLFIRWTDRNAPSTASSDGLVNELKERISALQSEVSILKFQLLSRRNETRALRRERVGYLKSVEQLKAHYASTLQSSREEHQAQLKSSADEAQKKAMAEYDLDRTRLLEELAGKENASRALQEEIMALKAAASIAKQQGTRLESTMERQSVPASTISSAAVAKSSSPLPSPAGKIPRASSSKKKGGLHSQPTSSKRRRKPTPSPSSGSASKPFKPSKNRTAFMYRSADAK